MDMNDLRRLSGLQPAAQPAPEPVAPPAAPSQVILILSNPQLAQYLSAMGLDISNSETGTQAMIPCDQRDTYLTAFSEMGYDDTDFAFKEEDMSNGYGSEREQDELGAHGDRYFPDGETSTPRNQAQMGPAAAKGGSNPMNFRESDSYKNLAAAYESYKAANADKELLEGEKGWNKSKEDAPDESAERDGPFGDDPWDDGYWPDDDDDDGEDLDEAAAKKFKK